MDYSAISSADAATHVTTTRLIDTLPQVECPICLTTFTATSTVYITNCHHVFCAACIIHQLNTDLNSKLCPLCRATITHIKLVQYTTPTTAEYKIVRIKFERQLYELCVSTELKLKQFKQQLAQQFSVDVLFIKLISNGRIVTTTDDLRRVLQHGKPSMQLIAAVRDYSHSDDGVHRSKSNCAVQ